MTSSTAASLCNRKFICYNLTAEATRASIQYRSANGSTMRANTSGCVSTSSVRVQQRTQGHRGGIIFTHVFFCIFLTRLLTCICKRSLIDSTPNKYIEPPDQTDPRQTLHYPRYDGAGEGPRHTRRDAGTAHEYTHQAPGSEDVCKACGGPDGC